MSEKRRNNPSRTLLTALGKRTTEIIDENNQKIEWNKKKENELREEKERNDKLNKKIKKLTDDNESLRDRVSGRDDSIKVPVRSILSYLLLLPLRVDFHCISVSAKFKFQISLLNL